MILHINNSNYESEVINSQKPVLLEFCAPWCVPCKAVSKIISEIDSEQDAIKIGKVDIEESPEIAVKHGIMNIPVLIFFKDGKPVEKMAGVKSKKAILEMLSK